VITALPNLTQPYPTLVILSIVFIQESASLDKECLNLGFNLARIEAHALTLIKHKSHGVSGESCFEELNNGN